MRYWRSGLSRCARVVWSPCASLQPSRGGTARSDQAAAVGLSESPLLDCLSLLTYGAGVGRHAPPPPRTRATRAPPAARAAAEGIAALQRGETNVCDLQQLHAQRQVAIR